MEDIPLIAVQSGDSSGISGTGEIPQERSDEEAHRPPHGKRPLGTEINSFSVILFKRTFSVASLDASYFLFSTSDCNKSINSLNATVSDFFSPYFLTLTASSVISLSPTTTMYGIFCICASLIL